MNRRDVSAVLGISFMGVIAGTVVVFLNRPQAPPIVEGRGGMQLVHPIYVGEVPLWGYLAVAVGCALAGAGLAVIALRMSKPLRTNRHFRSCREHRARPDLNEHVISP